MRTVSVPVGDRAYDIRIGAGLLPSIGERARTATGARSVVLVQDSGVAGHYGQTVRESLESAGLRVAVATVPAGEESKSLEGLAALYEAFQAARLDRKSAVVVLGGGVAGDLGGFAAATYLRGIQFVQIPTTLLAQVDSSVGGKTGIDLPGGKNLVGAFHQPSLVLADLDVLRTLSDRDFRSGLAEVIKYGVIADPELFQFLEMNWNAILAHQTDALAHVVARSCEIKADVVGKDEREGGLRAILNYGHTIGHAVEAVAGFGRYTHGEAVAIGMAAAGWLSTRHAGFSAGEAERVEGLIHTYGLPIRVNEPLAEDDLLRAMLLDKKTVGGELRFVLARRIGEVASVTVPEAEARAATRVVQPRAEDES